MPPRWGLVIHTGAGSFTLESLGDRQAAMRYVGGDGQPSIRQRATVFPHIIERVLPASTVYTDELAVYNTLSDEGYRHRRVNHSEKVYVGGDIHTNTIEGFWSLTKRGIGGVYHSVSAKHLQGYLNEYAWRYNERYNPRAKFSTLLRRAAVL